MSNAAISPQILVNGVTNGHVSALDRGFSLGDGLFETISVRDGSPCLWTEHMERLADGARRLSMPAPDAGRLRAEVEQCVGPGENGTLRITWTRGPGTRGYAIPAEVQPTRVVAWFAGAPDIPRTLRVRWCRTRLGDNPALAGIKHLNRLEQVLARSEWSDPSVHEGLMQDGNGMVIEGTSSNLFLVRDGSLVTPDLTRCGVAGVVRRRLLELANRLSIRVESRPVTRDELELADEIFMTSATRGVAPVAELETTRLQAPGPLSERLSAALEASLR